MPKQGGKMKTRDVVIVSGVRTPIGSFLGSLKDISAQSLGALVIREAVKLSSLKDSQIDEVIIGNCTQTEPGGNPAREALLEAGLPFEIPAFTVNKNCASSIKSVTLATTMIQSGEADIIVAGGMENLSRAPYLLRQARTGYRLGHGVFSDLLMDGLEGMGLTAERLAEKYRISREEQDEFACHSQMKAHKAQQAGCFKQEILAVKVPQKKGAPLIVDHDEGVKPNTTVAVLATLKPVFKKDGTVTAGNASTINDGAAAMVLMSADKAGELGIKPLAKIKAHAAAGCDPQIMGIGPVPATRRLLQKAGMTLADFDLIELNEAFAAQALAVLREWKINSSNVNIQGGAIAFGHPTGATGSILIVKLLHMMKRQNAKNGLVTLCIGGGQGMAIALENMN